jgi:peptidoglycan/xylan/chitin deacetylase (PgdA/CDA1 family)
MGLTTRLVVAWCLVSQVAPAWPCAQKVFLTLDTGNMSQADRIVSILDKHAVKATFFLANEKAIEGGWSLDDRWAPFWKRLVEAGHAFGNHTYDHVYFRSVDANGLVRAKPQFGRQAGQVLLWDQAALCDEFKRVEERFATMTGARLDAVWRAPGGRAPAPVFSMAQRCGYEHVYWAAAGFLGDELPSETYSNASLVAQALRTIRPGDILMAHLGIWSRKDPYAPMLDPLIEGLKAKGYCFATLREHPSYRSALRDAHSRATSRPN